MDTQLVVVGGGPGGYAAAFRAADLGMQVTLVNEEPRLGGVCLLRGCIPSKALLHLAKTISEAAELSAWGVNFSDVQIDVDKIRARKQKLIDTLTAGLGQLAKRRKVRVIRARATLENSQTLRLQSAGGDPLEDERVRFQHCILATGSQPASTPGLEPAGGRVMNSSDALELADVPESLLVVGGGYIGLELGTVYAALGSRVWLVEMTDQLLPGTDRDLVRPLRKRLQDRFEAIHLGTRVVGLTQKSDAVEVALEGDVADCPERFSRVLISVGRCPNTAGLGLENTKARVDRHGFVVVDSRQRTADEHILAVGDVAGEPMLAHKATYQGKVAVEALAGGAAEFAPRAVPAVVFTDPQIAWAGLSETEAAAAGRAVEVARFPWAASGRAQADGRTEGMTKWLIDPASDRVLGCGIVGAGAGELIGEAVLAIEMGAAVGDLSESIHPHPTLSETLHAAAEVHLGVATDLYRPKR